MAFSLSLLAPELQQQIVNCLRTEEKALKNWSCTSKYFRSFLAPRIFESIALWNTEESGSSVNRLITEYGQYIKELHFQGLAPGNENKEEDFSDTIKVFPEIVGSILSNLSQIPNLETVRVGFPIDFQEAGFSYEYGMFTETESKEEVAEAEENEGWRALMAKTFDALVQNTSPGFKNLVLENLMPVEVSTFNTAALQDLLRQMHRFELSLYGEENACWETSGSPGFQSFVGNLDTWFFNDLISVTDLTIHAHEYAHMGGGFAHLPLYTAQLPLVKALRLKNIVLCPGLQMFLVNHADTLEVLELTDCFACDEDHRIFWDGIFTSLIEAKPKKLRSLTILPSKLPLNDNDFPDDNNYMKDPDSDEIARVRRILKENPERRLFGYAFIDDKYSFLYRQEEDNLAHFLIGDDQRAYTELMEIVDANASRY